MQSFDLKNIYIEKYDIMISCVNRATHCMFQKMFEFTTIQLYIYIHVYIYICNIYIYIHVFMLYIYIYILFSYVGGKPLTTTTITRLLQIAT